MSQLEGKMKRILFLILFLVSCNTTPTKYVDIPNFDSNQAFTYLEKQCEFGPRNPGSAGHTDFSNYLKDFLSDLSGKLIIQEFVYIGAGSTIVNNISVGSRSIVGSGSVVIDSVDIDTCVIGVPARVKN